MIEKLKEILINYIDGDDRWGEKESSAYLSNLDRYFDRYQINDLFPYESYDIERDLFFNKETVGFIIEADPITNSDEKLLSDIDDLVNEVAQEEAYIQILLYADQKIDHILDFWEAPRLLQDPVIQTLASKRVKHFKDMISNMQVSPPRNFKILVTYSIAKKDGMNLEELESVKNRFQSTFSTHTAINKVDADRFIKIIYGFAYPKQSSKEVDKNWNMFENLSEQLGANGYRHKVEKNNMIFGDEFHYKSFCAVNFPEQSSIFKMGKLIGDFTNEYARLNCPFYISYNFYIPAQEKTNDKFFKDIAFVEHQGRSQMLRDWVPGLKEEFADYRFAREKINNGAKLIKANMHVGIFPNQGKSVREEQILLSLFKNNGFKLEENLYLHFPYFLSSMPFFWNKGYVENFKTKGLTLKTSLGNEPVNLSPLMGEWKGTKSPGMLLVGRRGQVATWSPFDSSTNYNTIVVGTSGSGKSMFMQDLLLSILGSGGRVFVLDVGRSFERTVKICSGQFIEFNRQSNLCLNPFSNIDTSDPEDVADQVSMIKSIIAVMACPTDKITDYQNAMIERAITTVIAEKGTKTEIEDIARWLESSGDEVSRQLGVMLTPYVKGGIYSKYFTGQNNIDFNNQFVVVEFDELKNKKELQYVILRIIMLTISNKVMLGDKKNQSGIFIDEAWDLLKGGSANEFIEAFARRIRKCLGALIVGSQGINDFYQSEGARAVIDNSAWKCLLEQSAESIDALKKDEKLSMTTAMEAALKSLSTKTGEYSEVMICHSKLGYSIQRLRLDKFSVLLYSTKAEEYRAIKDMTDKGMSIADAIESVSNAR